MKTLVLAEKPSVAKELARVLGARQKHKSHYEGAQYVVTWALGHLITLAEPEDYDDRYKSWKLEDLPIIPGEMKLKVIKETSHQFRAIEKLGKRSDLKELVIATDAGREGELVARWIMEKIRWKKPFKRLWISSQTDQAIKEGFAKLKPGSDYNRLYQSAVCRSEADWLIGLNVTRALTSKYNAQLSAGRVQTPTLGMIIEKEKAIRAFKPVDYWLLQADIGTFQAQWRQAGSGEARIMDRAKAEDLSRRLGGQSGKIIRLQKTEKRIPQPLAYDLTELQRDANRRYGFSAKQTSNILQRLYEQHKLVTYPRTDSRYLTSDMKSTFKSRLQSIAVGPYASLARNVLKQPLQVSKRIVDDSKVTDHHAIIPTEQTVLLNSLSNEERKLYDLIVRRFLALFYPPCRYDQTKVQIQVSGETLWASGQHMKDAGWKEVYGSSDYTDDEDEPDNDSGPEQLLPELKEGQTVTIRQCRIQARQTKPPARYTEASLLTQMEKHNLGTPATRADIIEKLLHSDTIERQGASLAPTGKGWQLIELAAEELRSPELTAKWELELERIAKGQGQMKIFLDNIRKQTIQLVQEVKQSTVDYVPHNLTHKKCPDCGERMEERKGKRGRFYLCSSRDCGYRQAAEPQLANKRCPQCRKKMEIHNGKNGKYVQCRPCNVVEQLDGSGGKAAARMNRKLVEKYSDNAPLGNSLGDALRLALEQQQSDK
ncbi:DNA topoisomerase III [Paenibacillus senegalensis]|uniref:DNA topoisomerase III n=1 Tax=Paenibacillus senegalensis TaxID=1465766 RepID=UPI000288B60A|nr:DNA topoisomerase III [Paenibacillus senegalensis]